MLMERQRPPILPGEYACDLGGMLCRLVLRSLGGVRLTYSCADEYHCFEGTWHPTTGFVDITTHEASHGAEGPAVARLIVGSSPAMLQFECDGFQTPFLQYQLTDEDRKGRAAHAVLASVACVVAHGAHEVDTVLNRRVQTQEEWQKRLDMVQPGTYRPLVAAEVDDETRLIVRKSGAVRYTWCRNGIYQTVEGTRTDDGKVIIVAHETTDTNRMAVPCAAALMGSTTQENVVEFTIPGTLTAPLLQLQP